MIRFLAASLAVLLGTSQLISAQTDSTEDFSQYDQLDFAEAGLKRYASPKILDLSPQKLISLGYDFQGSYNLTEGLLRINGQNAVLPEPQEETKFNYSHGIRFFANIPIISKSSVVWQGGVNYLEHHYQAEAKDGRLALAGLETGNTLASKGLRSIGLHTTLYKPLNEKQFLLFQVAADMNGDFSWNNIPEPSQLRYSAVAIWGKRPHDRLQWGVGLSRTYRVGEMNYIPVVMYNWTMPNRKWGTEILFPARAHIRRTFSPRSLALAGFELEGQSYQLGSLPSDLPSGTTAHLRRGEIRLRLIWERQIKQFIWFSAQVGYRINYRFNLDAIDQGREFYRGFFGDQAYLQANQLGNTPYAQFTINLVSP